MQQPDVKAALWNRHCALRAEDVLDPELFSLDPSPSLKAPMEGEGHHELKVYRMSSRENFPILRDAHGISSLYFLDYASVLVVQQLNVLPTCKVLDLCAAPGGKSIAISQLLAGTGELTSNDCQVERYHRLKGVVSEYVPKNTACTVRVTQKDGTLWHQPNYYDRVLVDAPCSAERHVVQQGVAGWTPDQTKPLLQVKLLLRAFEAAKVGGSILYCTCSISPTENDDVVATALSKTRVGVETTKTEFSMGEPTGLGWMYLPDMCGGCGPIYCCGFKKCSEEKPVSSSSDCDT